jgi:VWFA-related protein
MSARVLSRAALRLVALSAAALATAFSAAVPAPADKSIFVSALDESGKPVKDLTADEFAIREDGVDREVTGLKPATQTLNIVLLADTTKEADDFIQDIRNSLSAFVRQVHGSSADAQISLMEFGQAAVTMVPFTASTADLEKGINRVVGKPDADSVLLEALIAASNSLAKRPSPRRAVVVLNLEPSQERSREEPRAVNDSLRKSVAQVWAVSVQKGALKNPTRDVLLNSLTKGTGGQREFIVGRSAIETVLKGYADALTSQYELTYKRPDSARSAKVVQVGVRRQGLKLHASGFAPQ